VTILIERSNRPYRTENRTLRNSDLVEEESSRGFLRQKTAFTNFVDKEERKGPTPRPLKKNKKTSTVLSSWGRRKHNLFLEEKKVRVHHPVQEKRVNPFRCAPAKITLRQKKEEREVLNQHRIGKGNKSVGVFVFSGKEGSLCFG